MKAAPFDYIRPDTLDDACACLASHPEARIIAGGQSLVPMLAMRLARPSLVIDIAHIDGLSAIRDDGDALVIGTMVRQAAALSDPLIATHLPLLAKALTHVGHPPTRSRGTVGGSFRLWRWHLAPVCGCVTVMVTLTLTLPIFLSGRC